MVFKTIAELIADRTDCAVEDVKMESTFKDLGIDSLDTVELVMQLEEALDMEIELDQKVETVGNLVELVEARMKG